MNDVADACKLSKATLYHFADKSELLNTIADEHVSRLNESLSKKSPHKHIPRKIYCACISWASYAEYENAHHAHRVLTEDVRFLSPPAREAILDKERVVVRAFASALVALRPGLQTAHLETPSPCCCLA